MVTRLRTIAVALPLFLWALPGRAQTAQPSPPEQKSPAAPPSPATQEVDATGESPAPKPAEAQPAAAAPAKVEQSLPIAAGPALHHAPVTVAKAHHPLRIVAEIENPHLVRHAYVVYNIPNEPEPLAVDFLRAPNGEYVAIVPSEHVSFPEFRYTVELERVDGARVGVFGSREAPQRVLVRAEHMDLRERALLTRLGGRRSKFSASGDYVNFGKSDVQDVDPSTGAVTTRRVSDRYYRIEGGYAFRPLQLVTEFGLRAGIVRGKAPVPLSADQVAAGSAPEERFNVGLNYGAPYLRVRVVDLVHLDGEFVSSVNEVGFSLGAGAALVLGEPYGTNLTLGFETIAVFGTRFFTRMDVLASDRVTLSPIIEVTDMPHANQFGVRLLAQIGIDFGAGFSAAVRGGYQARTFNQGGGSVGLELGYAF